MTGNDKNNTMTNKHSKTKAYRHKTTKNITYTKIENKNRISRSRKNDPLCGIVKSFCSFGEKLFPGYLIIK